ncbi:CheY-P phosphatase CheC [Cohnella xylanilytica]|uniref:Chemotaxis protein CheC n=1 Tax=Cohnella xylanilytica TaxID=557555 RepID=A0A841TRR5_9BACL|nr:chemotaxis protein CheC [Cohnella xylanilytica]MBB6690845.1 chemotaxis protein CheC [Cohnella xylanilytica]GIO10880.1 CheY-P phosphatase CheC [Cohnella xylanilytica]
MKLFRHNPDFKMDVLREVGNIGAGHAATALSRLLDKPIDMAVPTVSFVPFESIADRAGGPEEVVVAIFLRVDGDAPGNMFFLMSRPQARRLLQGLAGFEASGEDAYSELELSALCEIGNILAGSYLTSLADLTGLSMSPTVPSIAVDMAGAILTYGLLQFGTMGDDALLIDTTFLKGEEEAEGQFFFIPDPESFERMFLSLGVPLE